MGNTVPISIRLLGGIEYCLDLPEGTNIADVARDLGATKTWLYRPRGPVVSDCIIEPHDVYKMEGVGKDDLLTYRRNLTLKVVEGGVA